MASTDLTPLLPLKAASAKPQEAQDDAYGGYATVAIPEAAQRGQSASQAAAPPFAAPAPYGPTPQMTPGGHNSPMYATPYQPNVYGPPPQQYMQSPSPYPMAHGAPAAWGAGPGPAPGAGPPLVSGGYQSLPSAPGAVVVGSGNVIMAGGAPVDAPTFLAKKLRMLRTRLLILTVVQIVIWFPLGLFMLDCASTPKGHGSRHRGGGVFFFLLAIIAAIVLAFYFYFVAIFMVPHLICAVPSPARTDAARRPPRALTRAGRSARGTSTRSS